MENRLKNCIDKLDDGQFPSFIDIMIALGEVTEYVTLDERPAGDPELITICELNGRVCSQ